MPSVMDLVERGPIKKQREKLGLTQQQLAAKVGVEVKSIMQWERGHSPRPEQFAPLASALGYTDTRKFIEEWRKWRG